MEFTFEYTGLRVKDLDRAIDFFTKVLGMKLEARVKADWNKGEFANLFSADGKHKLELSWYAADSRLRGRFVKATSSITWGSRPMISTAPCDT